MLFLSGRCAFANLGPGRCATSLQEMCNFLSGPREMCNFSLWDVQFHFGPWELGNFLLGYVLFQFQALRDVHVLPDFQFGALGDVQFLPKKCAPSVLEIITFSLLDVHIQLWALGYVQLLFERCAISVLGPGRCAYFPLGDVQDLRDVQISPWEMCDSSFGPRRNVQFQCWALRDVLFLPWR